LGPTFTGKSLAEIAKAPNSAHPAEAVLNLLVASRDQIIVFWHDVHEEILEMMLKHPLALIATDGSGYNISNNTSGLIPHPRSFGTTAKILGRYVRDRKILNLEEAVHKMSGRPAQWLGLKDRGAVIKNYYADLVIFDPKNIADLSTYENPFKYPTGLKHVLVNGTLTIENGEYKKILAGQVLGKNI
jgi:N-acyl-D-amino-acid deacylase